MDGPIMALHQVPGVITLVAIYIVFGTTFTLAGGMKILEKSVPGWFKDQFSKTFLGSFPGVAAAYWILALLECSVPLLLVFSLVQTEFLPEH